MLYRIYGIIVLDEEIDENHTNAVALFHSFNVTLIMDLNNFT